MMKNLTIITLIALEAATYDVARELMIRADRELVSQDQRFRADLYNKVCTVVGLYGDSPLFRKYDHLLPPKWAVPSNTTDTLGDRLALYLKRLLQLIPGENRNYTQEIRLVCKDVVEEFETAS